MPAERNSADLGDFLRRIDGRGYPAYKELRGAWSFPLFELHIDHVQGDPFAAPSSARVRVPMSEAKVPSDFFANSVRRVATQDFIARRVRDCLEEGCTKSGTRGSGKSGLIQIDAGGQEVIERASIVICDSWIEARMEVGLPASGRRIQGRAAERLLLESLPNAALGGLLWEPLKEDSARFFVDCIENQESIRASLEARGLIAFVGDGAVLPRESGNSERPLRGEDAIPFRSPPEFNVNLPIPHPAPRSDGSESDSITGMGIPRGVTLIVGGGTGDSWTGFQW